MDQSMNIIIYKSKLDERVFQTIYQKRALPQSSVDIEISRNNVKFKTTFKNCVYDAFQYREWKQTWDDDWNVIWCEK